MELNNESGATPAVTPQAATANNPVTPQGATPAIQPDTAAQIATLTSERDSANARIRELNRENKDYRLLSDFVKSLGVTPEELKTKWEADAARLAAYEPFGTPEEIEAKNATLEKDANEAKQLRLEKIAEKAGFKSTVLADQMASKGFQVELREEKDAEGKTIQVPTAIYREGDKDEAKPLVEYAEKFLPDYLPALRVEAVATASGASWLPQPSGNEGGSPKNTPENEYIANLEKASNEKKNPLMRG